MKKQKLIINNDEESITPNELFLCCAQGSPENLTFSTIKEFSQNSKLIAKEQTSIKQINLLSSHSHFESQNSVSLDSNRFKIGSLSTKKYKIDRSIQKQITQMKEMMKKKSIISNKIFNNNNVLEQIVKRQKVKSIVKNFTRKIKRTSNIYSEPAIFQKLEKQQNLSILTKNGYQFSSVVDNLITVLSVLQIICLLAVYSLSLVFEDVLNSGFVSTMQTFSLVFYFVQIIFNCITIKSSAGKRVTMLGDIIELYAKGHLWIDLVSLLILVVDLSADLSVVSYFRLFIFAKLPQCIDKIQKLEVYFVQNFYNQQYWSLVKVFLFNFSCAHIIAMFLAGMTKLDLDNNWMVAKGIDQAPWYQQYIWSYYWGNTIMLTVGFGDIVASNWKEALCLTFIETFSCIVLVYNVNCVGNLINNIRRQDLERSKKYKIFKKLTSQNYVPEDLNWKINNYIEESSNLRKKFNYEQDNQFIQSLPSMLKKPFLKEANKQVLQSLVFFRNLLDKTLFSFAEKIQTKIAHPQEIIRAVDDDFHLIILKKGEIGYACKRNGFSFSEEIADLISVKEGESPFLTSLDFITKRKPFYQIKSLEFSVLFRLNYSDFVEVFKQNEMDYELYCLLRDKIKNVPDQFQVYPCEYCPTFNHFKFTCPKLHYIPYEQHVIDRQLHAQKHQKNSRRKIDRIEFEILKPFQYYNKLKQIKDIKIAQKPKIKSTKKQILSNKQNTSTSIKRSRKCNVLNLNTAKLESEKEEFKTREIISSQIFKFYRMQNYEDNVWIINTDLMMNFNGYFSSNNPCNLDIKFNNQPAKNNQQINDQQKTEEQTEKIENVSSLHYIINIKEI